MDLDVGTGVESSARASRSAFDARIDRDARDRRRSARGAVGHHASDRPTDRPLARARALKRPITTTRARTQRRVKHHIARTTTDVAVVVAYLALALG